MVAMQMRDENLADFARFNRRLQDLVLGTFTAVKHPDLIDFLQKLEDKTGHIASLGGLTGSGS